MPRSDPAGGFSLIELMVVLALLALAAALAGPRIGAGGERAALRQAAAEVRALLVAARAEARRSGIPQSVGPAGPDALLRRPAGNRVVLRNVRVEAGDPVAFLPDGGAVPGAIRLTGAGGGLAVRVEPFLGAVTIEAPPDG
jgi:prepilin-type N-terminal cleavage/methylation domain-containing protein